MSPQSELSHGRERGVGKSVVTTLGAAVLHLYQQDEDSIVVALN